jgi:maltose O-acetyltransferase
MPKFRWQAAFWYDLNFVVFNYVMNLFPDDLLSNSYIRPFIARIFGLKRGKDCQIRKGIYFEGQRKMILGRNVFLNRQSYFDAEGGIKIGNNVRFGPQTMLITGNHEIGESQMRAGEIKSKPIVIGDGCWLGARITVTAGVTIGEGSIVSAGAVVQRSMPANSLIAGNPARPIYPLDKPSLSKGKRPD